MATYEDKMKDLGSLSPDELNSLEGEIKAAFEAADEADDLDAMSAAADALDTVRAEIANKTSEAPAEDEAPTAEVVAASGEATEAPEKGADTEDTDDADDADAGEGNDNAAEAAQAEGEDVVDVPESRQPAATKPAVTITAGADIPGRAAGTEFTDSYQVAEAFTKRLNSMRNISSHGDGEKMTVATITAAGDPTRTLYAGDLEGNTAKIKARKAEIEAMTVEAITASGGYCAPLEVRYDIFGLGSAARPVRDSLLGFNADRGGIRFVAPPRLGDLESAVGVWTAANDADPGTDGPATKNCMVVECSPEVTAIVDAVTLCLQFGNLQTRAFPELVSANNELALIQHARLAELTLLGKISALSTKATSSMVLGTARDFLEALGRGAAAYRARFRMDPDTPLRALAPVWVRDAMREDLAWGLPGDNVEVADAIIDRAIAARNVSVTWHLDDTSFGVAQPEGSALSAWPASFKWTIFAEGTFLYLDGGTLDLGIVRDSELVSTNDYKTFTETFEGVAKVGLEAVEVTTTTAVTGHVAATHDTTPEPVTP